MPRAEFEPITPVFERAKPVHVLDRSATVIGEVYVQLSKKHFRTRMIH
jgi:hypothetical protein